MTTDTIDIERVIRTILKDIDVNLYATGHFNSGGLEVWRECQCAIMDTQMGIRIGFKDIHITVRSRSFGLSSCFDLSNPNSIDELEICLRNYLNI